MHRPRTSEASHSTGTTAAGRVSIHASLWTGNEDNTMTRHEKSHSFVCPHCWNRNGVTVDLSAESRERFIEDCPVCGNPVLFRVEVEHGDLAGLSTEIPAIPRRLTFSAAAPHTTH